MTPEKKFKAGTISATVWRNKNEKGEFASIQIDRSYKDKDQQWKHTNSFTATDLPKAILVMNKAYEYIVSKHKDQDEV